MDRRLPTKIQLVEHMSAPTLTAGGPTRSVKGDGADGDDQLLQLGLESSFYTLVLAVST
jgi:hypothetical protein